MLLRWCCSLHNAMLSCSSINSEEILLLSGTQPAEQGSLHCVAQVQAHLYESVIKQEMARRQKRAKAKAEPKSKGKPKADVPKVSLQLSR